MQILHVTDYNAMQMRKYHEAWDKWELAGGYNTNMYHPQQAFYGFYTNQGAFRMHGYVAFGNHKALWRPTKKQAIADFNK